MTSSSPSLPGAIPAPPRRFGYSVVAAAFVVQALSIGLSVIIFPVFMQALERDLGATRTQSSFGIPIVLLMGAAISPFVGRQVDRGSPRLMMLAGALVMGAGLVALSQASSLAIAAIVWVVFVGVGHSLMGPLPASTVIANWFIARRATMIAMAAMGMTVAGAVLPPTAEALIAALGWRGALAVLGIACALIGAPVVWFGIVKTPGERGLHPDGAPEAPPPVARTAGDAALGAFLRDPVFWRVALGFACMSAIAVAFITHLLPWAQERGLDREQAVLLLTANALGAATGKLSFGAICDRLGARLAVLIAIGFEALGWSILLWAGGAYAFPIGSVLFSVGSGSMVPTHASVIGSVWGVARFGIASGLVGIIGVLAIFFGPTSIGVAFDATGSYTLPMTAALVVLCAPALLLGTLKLERGNA